MLKFLKSFSKKSITSSQLNGMISSSSGYHNKTYSDDRSQLSAYCDISWIAVAVDRIYDAVSTQDFYFEDLNGKLLEKNRLDKSIQAMFYESSLNIPQVIATVTAQLKLTGNAYILAFKNTAYGFAYNINYDTMRLIPPDKVRIFKTLDELNVDYYEVTLGNGAVLRVSPNDTNMRVIHIKQYPIFDGIIGVGNIAKSRLLAEGKYAQQKWINEYNLKKGSPSLIITDKSQRSIEDMRRIQRMISDTWEGAKNAGKVGYLSIDGNVQQFSPSQRDMQWVEREQLDRQAILSIFGVPTFVAGIPDNSNRATSITAFKEFYRNTVNPTIKLIEDTIQSQLIQKIDPNVKFKIQKYATGDIDEAIKMIQSGIITPNRASEMLGEAWDEADEYRSQFYMPSNLLPLGALSDNNNDQSQDNSKKKNQDGTPKNFQAVVAHFLKSATEPKRFQAKFILASLKSVVAVEDKYTSKISDYFIEAGKRIASKVEENAQEFQVLQMKSKKEYDSLVGSILNLNEEDKELKRVLQAVWISGIQRAIGDINVITGSKVNLNTSNPFVSQALRALGSRIVGTVDKNGKRISINETTRKEVEKIVTDSINESLSINQIQDRIQDKFSEWSGYRARRIARTEARTAWDYGAQVAYVEIGVKTVDIVGCTQFEQNSDCGKQNIPVMSISTLSFHPNHIGTPAPSIEPRSSEFLISR